MKKLRLYLISLILILISLYLIIVPYFVSYSIKNIAQVNKVKFDPLRLLLEIDDFRLNENLFFGKIYINFSFSNLFNKELHISKIIIDGLDGNIVKKDEPLIRKGVEDIAHNIWKTKIDKIEILNSELLLDKKHQINLEKVEVQNFNWPIISNISTKFKVSANIKESKVFFDGEFLEFKLLSRFKLDNLDLSMIDAFGKVRGLLSGEGVFKLNDGVADAKFDLKAQDIFVYSEDLELINYFVESLDAKDLTIISDKSSLKIGSGALEVKNLLFSIPTLSFNQNDLTKVSKIKINNIDIEKNDSLMKGFIRFENKGYIASNQYMKGSKQMLDIKVNNVDLAQFSNSFESQLRYHIESGKLFVDAKIIKGSKKIKGNVAMNFSQLNLDNKNELGKKIDSQSSIPLKTVLLAIKDNDGNVKLDFKIYGDKNDPSFNIFNMFGKGIGSMIVSKITSIAAVRAVTEVAPTLIATMPISPGNALFVAKKAYNIVTKDRFKDVEFILRSDVIRQNSKKDLEDVVEFLKKDKKITLRICPVASSKEFSDNKIKFEKVLNLANLRIASIKGYLRKFLGDKILEKVVFCRPTISEDDNISKALISI